VIDDDPPDHVTGRDRPEELQQAGHGPLSLARSIPNQHRLGRLDHAAERRVDLSEAPRSWEPASS
jgi:hypothetical protein